MRKKSRAEEWTGDLRMILELPKGKPKSSSRQEDADNEYMYERLADHDEGDDGGLFNGVAEVVGKMTNYESKTGEISTFKQFKKYSSLALRKRNKVKVIEKLLQEFNKTEVEDQLKVLVDLDTALTDYNGNQDASKLQDQVKQKLIERIKNLPKDCVFSKVAPPVDNVNSEMQALESTTAVWFVTPKDGEDITLVFKPQAVQVGEESNPVGMTGEKMSGIVNVDVKKQLPPGLDAEGYKIRLIDDLRIPRVSIPLGGECIQEATASLVDSYLGKVLGIEAGLCGAPHAQLATMWVGLPEDLGKSQAEPTDEFGVTIEWIDDKDIKECTGEDLALIPTADVHQMALFNLIIGQTDGWEAKVDEKGRLRPLDNALTFPDGLVEFQHSEVKTNMYDVEINLPHLDEPLDEDLAAKLIELDSEQMAAVLKASVPELRAGSILVLPFQTDTSLV